MNTPTYGNYDPLHVSVQPPMEHAVVTLQATICSPPATQVISPEHVPVSQSFVSNVKVTPPASMLGFHCTNFIEKISHVFLLKLQIQTLSKNLFYPQYWKGRKIWKQMAIM